MADTNCEKPDKCEDPYGDLRSFCKWRFDEIWWYSTLSLCTAFILFVLYDFILKKSRRTPSKLMLGRMISNYCQVLVFMLTAQSGVNICSDAFTCDTLGALFTISLLISASYYTVICFDLYFTLKNPFRQPASNSMWIHFIVILTACCITIPIGTAKAFEYREDFQFCWTVYKDGFNFWNLFIVYVPAAGVIIGGIAVTYWSLKRLQARILDDTFELRWKVIKRQTAIVGCFTINYVVQGIIWSITFMQHKDTPTRDPPQPYLLSVFVFCGVLFDLIAWCAKDSVLICWKSNAIGSVSNIYDETETSRTTMMDSLRTIEHESMRTQTSASFFVELKDHNAKGTKKTITHNRNIDHSNIARPMTARTQLLNEKYSSETKTENKIIKKMAQQQNLSNALRREVITFITAGLVQCIKVTAWETNKRNTHLGSTYDDDDFQHLDSGYEYSGNYREDTETHPALQLFVGHNHYYSNASTPYALEKEKLKRKKARRQHNRRKGNSYPGKSREKRGQNTGTDSSNGFSERHRDRRGSYKYQAKLGKHSTVAVSIPIAMNYVDGKTEAIDFTDTRTVDEEDEEDEDEDETLSTSNHTPSISSSNNDDHNNDITSTTLNAEDNDCDWREDQTLEFDVGNNINNDAAIYSASLFATDEAEPSHSYYPQSIKVTKATKKNTGTVNRFNIGIAGSDKVSFTDYAPHVFRYLRTKIYKVNDSNYLESILPAKFGGAITRVSEDIIANFSEGRSGAFFFFTPDNKYLIKTITKDEAQLLIDTLKDYVQYMKDYGSRTFLTKYYGLHSVKLYSKVIYFMVSGNIFPSNKVLADQIKERYDIKGSWIDRHTNRHLFENKLMKDEDLHRKLRLDPIVSSNIHNQLVTDTCFLQKQNIMDYSLLLGISYQQITNKNKKANNSNDNNYSVGANIVEGPGTYYIGLIDMLQKWNQQKKGERFIKVYFRCKNRAGISCVEPTFYRKRFLKKMHKMGL